MYIDTGIIPNNNTIIEASVKEANRIASWSTFCGSGVDFKLQKNGWLSELRITINGKDWISPTILNNKDSFISFKIGNGNIKIDNSLQQLNYNYGNTFNAIHNLYIFSTEGADVVGGHALEYFKIYENEKLIRDFRPALDMNSIPCLFDFVEFKKYYNKGEGQFLYG